MQTIVVAQQKGGCGKTTLVRNLAVAAGAGTVVIDTDPQGTLTGWWNKRESDAPALATVAGTIRETLDQLRADGAKLVLVDTPPSKHQFVSDVIRAADLVLIPVKPSPDDLDAVGATLDMVEGAGRNFIFCITQAKARTRLLSGAVRSLAQHGKVAPVTIYDRVEFPTAAITGQGVTETVEDSPAAAEVQALLTYVRKQLRTEARK
jgi:chromosome partitioning protein